MLTDIQHSPVYDRFFIINMQKGISNVQEPVRKPMVLTNDKYDRKSIVYNGCQSASIIRRNARERSRVKQVNDGFNALRKRLPASVISALSSNTRRSSGKKLSKVDTLRMVVEYIKHLQSVVEESDETLVTRSVVRSDTSYERNDNYGIDSPYSESAQSPQSSEYSSGLSSIYTRNAYTPQDQYEQTHNIEENDILSSIYW